MSGYPDSAKDFERVLRLADPGARLHIVLAGGNPARLPGSPELVTGRVPTAGKVVLNGVALWAVTVAGVFLATVTAWDHDGFFPWFWNVVWLLFPWFFLLPLWAAFCKLVAQYARGARFAKAYREVCANPRPARGTVDDEEFQRAKQRLLG
ncbi:SHOCT domain-containing protein [Saccharopolyspora shandongensis]|uniref:SHOCT domain-containing protein n=1 Tax=Saccharopolyspora shandongensis TaxID=418495 RepID=UPI0034362EBC